MPLYIYSFVVCADTLITTINECTFEIRTQLYKILLERLKGN